VWVHGCQDTYPHEDIVVFRQVWVATELWVHANEDTARPPDDFEDGTEDDVDLPLEEDDAESSESED
jgi:hypothetical protein